MNRYQNILISCATLFAAGMAQQAAGQTFDLTIQSAQSNVSSSFTFNAQLPGTLIGTYTAENTAGSRTKPGLFGSFGDTENVAVSMSVSAGVTNAAANSPVIGSFAITIDTQALTATVSNYTTSLFTTSPAMFPVTANVTIPSFRTRNPSSTYIAATLPVPLGDANITLLRADQEGDALGTLTPVSPGTYDFTVGLMVVYTVTGDLAGIPIDSVGTPAPLVFSGQIVIDENNNAVLTSTGTLSYSDTQTPAQVLPPTNFDLPTVLPPGLIVPVILNLTLNTVTTGISGTQQVVATGGIAPPACFADYNQDGGIDGTDVDFFFVDWSAGSFNADVNQDGGVDGADVDLFFVQWSAGGC